MAKLSSFIYCLNAERVRTVDGKGELINAMGVLSAITPEFVPGTFSFSIIFSIINVDIKKNNSIQIIFLDNDNKEIINSNVISLPPAEVEDDAVSIPDEYKGLNMSMDMRNVVLEKEGLYHTKIIFNGEPIGTNEIYVKGRR